MGKRKLTKEVSVEESDLSPPPNGLLNGEDVTPNRSTLASPSKKRKVKEVKKEVVEENIKLGKSRVKKAVAKTVPKVEDNDEIANQDGTTKGKKQIKREVVEEEHEEPENDDEAPTKVEKKRKVKTKPEAEVSEDQANGEKVEKVKRKRKTKEEKEAEAMPLAARTVGHKLFIGAHVSSAGGVQNSVLNSVQIGANAFALFLKSQRKWANPPLADDQCTTFHDNCRSHTYDQHQHVVPHGSYLVNLAHTDKARTEQAYEAFLDDLRRCERLGIKLYNFHPGVANSVGGDRQAAIKHLASNINRAHKDTSSVVTLLENMAHGGSVLGSTFEDLRDTIGLVQNKDRVGVCLDTCHAFAGGYDLRSPAAFEATMKSFDDIVGVQYLRAVHMNDSKAPFSSHRDLHANIGTGFLGLRAFHNLVNDSRFEGLPLILETPIDAKDEDGVPLKDDKGKEKEDRGIWAREIKMLESLVGMDAESDEFLKLEKALARKGEPERKKLSDQIEKKREKDALKADKGAKKKVKKGLKVEEDDDGEDSPLTELDDEAEADGIEDTQRLSE